jgi:ADP-heptose:LPS heptosyltransferase
MKRSTAFLINGGAGRVLCAIPALEIFEIENPADDFIIIVEHGIEFFKGHPTLYKRCFEFHHKNLFHDKIKDRNYLSPEPYHVWEYYNQQASICQAFDIAINQKGLRHVGAPRIKLSNEEHYGGIETVKAIKNSKKNKKTIVFQPFGRGSNMQQQAIQFDMFGKSFFMDDVVNIIEQLQQEYIVILMTESNINFKDLGYTTVEPAQITGLNLRKWFAIINAADYFLGCDSVGQHAAYGLNKKATVVLGGTFKENVSYPEYGRFDILDFGEGKKSYSPIRLCYDEVADLANESIMKLTTDQLKQVIESVKNNIGE